jgi:hypothetical protein
MDKKKKFMLYGLIGVVAAAIAILYLMRQTASISTPNTPADEAGASIPQVSGANADPGSYATYNIPAYQPNPFPIVGPADLGYPSGGCCKPTCEDMTNGLVNPSMAMWSSFMYGG